MDGDLDSATRYRQRAEELWTIAETTNGTEYHQTLIDIAADYERMAEQRERIAAMDDKIAEKNTNRNTTR
jgi:hypothetical protein